MRVLATGANGHLGANVVRSLLARGHEVVPFVRPDADLRGLKGLDLSYAHGDIMDQPSLIRAAEGCEAMVHMAAVYRYWSKDPNDVMQPALIGTHNALTAAREAGLRRVVYTSTTWAIGVTKDPNRQLTAANWNENPHTPYAMAKTQAEKEAWRLAGEFGLEMTSICPGGMLGPYDYRITPSTKLIRDIVNGAAPIFKGGLCYADVRDVAEMHAGAVELREAGGRYIAAGENKFIEDYGRIITELTGVKPMRLPGGRSMFQLVAVVAEAAAAVTKSEPILTQETADDLGERYMFLDSADSFRTFGITRKNATESLREGIRWLLHVGEIKRSTAQRIRDKFPPDPSWLV